MDDLIRRQAALDALTGKIEITGRADAVTVAGYIKLVMDRIEQLPAADVAERKKGRWIKNDFYDDALMCSCCHAYLDKEDWNRHYFYFCFHCGAFMEGMDCDTDTKEEKDDAETH